MILQEKVYQAFKENIYSSDFFLDSVRTLKRRTLEFYGVSVNRPGHTAHTQTFNINSPVKFDLFYQFLTVWS